MVVSSADAHRSLALLLGVLYGCATAAPQPLPVSRALAAGGGRGVRGSTALVNAYLRHVAPRERPLQVRTVAVAEAVPVAVAAEPVNESDLPFWVPEDASPEDVVEEASESDNRRVTTCS